MRWIDQVAFERVRLTMPRNIDICSGFWSKKSSKKPAWFSGAA
jgi:hypothetical protein